MMARLFDRRVALVVALGTLLATVILLAGAWLITTARVDSNQRKQDRDLCELLDAISYPRTGTAGNKFETRLKSYESRHCHG